MRTYGESIDVRTAGAAAAPAAGPEAAEAPAQFLWRGRLYVVRAVLAHWIELGSWWTAPARPARRTRLAERPGPDRSDVDADAHHEQGPDRRSVALDVGAVERAVWRVEARAGRSSLTGVYDLVHDIPAAAPGPFGSSSTAGRWRLARTLD